MFQLSLLGSGEALAALPPAHSGGYSPNTAEILDFIVWMKVQVFIL
jgi:hypothetical protein